MGLVARDELGIDPRELPVKGLIVHLGIDDRASLEALWGADAYDTYGCNECGTMAAECSHKSGMHVFEDAFVIEVNDPETLQPKASGERGVVFITTLFKYAAPMIRYNMNDVTSVAAGDCACGSVHRRITKIFGRSDNMVKLRGVNVFPEAIGAIVGEDRAPTASTSACSKDADGERESMTVLVEIARSRARRRTAVEDRAGAALEGSARRAPQGRRRSSAASSITSPGFRRPPRSSA